MSNTESAVRVAFIYPGEYGDFADVLEYVSHLRRMGLDARFIGRMSTQPEIFRQSISGDGEPLLRNDHETFHKWVERCLEAFAPHYVHVFHFRGAYRIAMSARRLGVNTSILDVRTLHVESRGRAVGRIGGLLRDRITWLEAHAFDVVIVLTPAIRRALWPLLKRTYVVELGANWEYLATGCAALSRKAFRRRFEIPDMAVVFFYGGTLSAARNVDILVRAFASADFGSERPYLVVAGGQAGARLEDDPDVARLRVLARTLGVEGRVRFTGRVSYYEMLSMIPVGDVGLAYVPYKSRYRHQPQTKLIQYMMAGLVAVANRTKPNLELVEDGMTGLVCGETEQSIAAAMTRALHLVIDREGSKLMGEAARAAVESRSWTQILRESLLPIYVGGEDTGGDS